MSPKKFSKMLLLSLLHLSHSADEAERIIYILQLFHETSCSIKRPVHTMDAISCTQSEGGGGGQLPMKARYTCAPPFIGKMANS